MKKLIILFLILPLFFACDSKVSTYKKTIADYVQTDRSSKYDLKFKVIKIEGIYKITIGDKLEEVKRTNDSKIKEQEKIIERNQNELKKYNSTYDYIFKPNIERAEDEIKSIKEDNDQWKNKYKDAKPDDAYVIIVHCKYSYFPLLVNTKTEETRYFILSPDGKTCYDSVVDFDVSKCKKIK